LHGLIDLINNVKMLKKEKEKKRSVSSGITEPINDFCTLLF
jgi:hypothetical protein